MHGRTWKLVGYSEQHKQQQQLLILTKNVVIFLFECAYGKLRFLPLRQQGYFVLIVEDWRKYFLSDAKKKIKIIAPQKSAFGDWTLCAFCDKYAAVSKYLYFYVKSVNYL
jgi:hypothetical protein